MFLDAQDIETLEVWAQHDPVFALLAREIVDAFEKVKASRISLDVLIAFVRDREWIPSPGQAPSLSELPDLLNSLRKKSSSDSSLDRSSLPAFASPQPAASPPQSSPTPSTDSSLASDVSKAPAGLAHEAASRPLDPTALEMAFARAESQVRQAGESLIAFLTNNEKPPATSVSPAAAPSA